MTSGQLPVDLWLDARDGRLFVGSYAPLRLGIGPESGLTLDDLDITVPDGLAGGLVSMARGPRFDPARPEVMLLAGHTPGTYRVVVTDRNSGSVVGETSYEVVGHWPEEEQGPAQWFSGRQPAATTGAAWGGGDPDAPQNHDVFPALGVRRVAIVFVDTASRRYTTDPVEMQAHRDRWLDEIVRGVKGPDGVIRSSAAWFREVSYGNFDLTAEAFGPVQLPGTFTDYFEESGESKGRFKGNFAQECITAADSLIDYARFDTVLLVSQSVPAAGTDPDRSAWPYASVGGRGPFTTSDGHRILGIVSMPNEWGTADDREIHESFSHELGHNLGLFDQYTPAVPGRNVGSWDIMDWDDPLPHPTLVHRMMLGWVPADWLRRLNFADGSPVDQTVTLSPVEGGAPAPGTYAGIEIRIADGYNYYLEYRNGEAPDIGDRRLPADNRVVGTDVTAPEQAPVSRPQILLLRSDGDDSGPVLGNGGVYTETDHSDPLFPTDFSISVSGIDGTKADVHIRYGVSGCPDPSIRPWPASPQRPWQSPDIEVRNARSDADPTWLNVPWLEHANTVVAQVRNRGDVNAPGVRVDFYVKDYNIGGAPEFYIGSDTRTVPVGAPVEFSTVWVPPKKGGHFCVMARIPLYVVPSALSVVERTELNNQAQSNYDRFIASTASPSTRETTSCTVTNPYRQRARVFVVAAQSNPLYRTFVEHTWLWLNAGETRRIGLMFEYAPDPDASTLPPDIALRQDDVEEYRWVSNRVSVHSQIEDPTDERHHHVGILGGAQAEVTTGRATRIDDFEVRGPRAAGTVVAVGTGDRVDGGKVIVTVDGEGTGPESYTYRTVPVRDGAFEAAVPEGWRAVRADFLPPTGSAPSAAGWVRAGGERRG
ncbi:hypothetical protein [Streptomyces spinosisporus]|uniref:M6 family metalloprotease domain-containing protein n=1 Tax=Streptomyces spinosisporus TaxID=2927582 RepID=A0ABS9XCR5_9ACTN|nr:hypothetical protein [Streptomyces spinosisporus]MCI3239854.1 hypothetical protein [Streptomyces spinosisporus]